MEGNFPVDMSETLPKGVGDYDYLSKGVRTSFPEGSFQLVQGILTSWRVIPKKLVSYGGLLSLPTGIPNP